jgi:DNA polymerase IIIc chi subunit
MRVILANSDPAEALEKAVQEARQWCLRQREAEAPDDTDPVHATDSQQEGRDATESASVDFTEAEVAEAHARLLNILDGILRESAEGSAGSEASGLGATEPADVDESADDDKECGGA